MPSSILDNGQWGGRAKLAHALVGGCLVEVPGSREARNGANDHELISHWYYPLDAMQLGILGGAGADGLQVLEVAVTATRTLKAMVEQPAHNLLIIGNMPIGIEPKDMGLAG